MSKAVKGNNMIDVVARSVTNLLHAFLKESNDKRRNTLHNLSRLDLEALKEACDLVSNAIPKYIEHRIAQSDGGIKGAAKRFKKS